MELDQYEKELVGIAEEIVRHLIKSGINRADAEDVTQDVFLKMLEGRFVVPKEKLRAWMYRVAIRHYIDKYRRNRRYQEILQQEFFDGGLISMDRVDTSELYDLLTVLPNKYYLILELYYFQDFSVKEISRILHISPSKVKIDLMRGRNQLKKWIKERELTYEDFIKI
ncbi:RNA polymerase sigma-70 factor (ECF subfamily) [Streptococcus rupicaprae]|uniref:RNA polymerase sigma-70 factor (ECF subfamily) n=1 Tax=Streptococcus rupicaprae TaxID=759619 RepID=A0ABV2FKM7_9STRE